MLAAIIPIVGFAAGWTAAKPDGRTTVPAPAAETAATAPTTTTTPAPPGTPSLEEALRLGEEAARRWLEDWAAVARLSAGSGVTGDQPAGNAGAAPTQQAAAGELGVPVLMLQTYQAAEQWAAGYAPGCRLSWNVMAGVGRVESNHGRHAGAGFTASGDVQPPILGIPLDGRPGVKHIADTDRGRWDGDTTYDRAVGPMQFLPTSWAALGRDGNGDGVANPHNAFDAAVSAAAYLCRSAGGSLADRAVLERALHAYNHSPSYVQTVLAWADAYGASGATPLDNPPPR